MAVEKHKPGPLKQQNKPHKHGKHRSKGTVDKQNKGKVSVKCSSQKGGKQSIGKINRRLQAKQLRSKKRDEVLEKKRKIGKQGSPPHIIAIVPLSSSVDSQAVLQLFVACDEENSVFHSNSSTTVVSPQLKQRFTFLVLKYGDPYSILDAMKVTDTVVFITAANEQIDLCGDKILSAVFAQGLPTTFHGIQAERKTGELGEVIVRTLPGYFFLPFVRSQKQQQAIFAYDGLENCPVKKRNDIKKKITKMVEQRFPKEKPHPLDSAQDALVALRLISNQHQRTIHFRENRPHLLAQNVVYGPNEDPSDADRGTLKVTGYIRGKTLSANRLVHLPGYGDFQMSQIEAVTDMFSTQIKRKMSKAEKCPMAIDEECGTSAMEEDARIIDEANPALQESLQSEVEPDPMEGEQTWPTESELQEAEEMAKKQLEHEKTTKRVPKGTSDYQASWIMDGDSDNAGESGSDDDEEDGEDGEDEYISAVREESDGDDESMKMDDDEEFETISVSGQETDNVKYDDAIDLDEELLQLEKIRAERENEMFPDEIDTPMNISARSRFQKYRGLKSFRTSSWDPKENLPRDYARIFQFQNFTRTRKRIMCEDEVEGAEEGWYVTLHIINVPKSFIDSYDASKPLVVFGLLPHEQKMSVVHFVVKRVPTNNETVKSKERLIFHCGYRRFAACPVFSEHTSGNKHKYERFLPHEDVCVMSVYAPIMFSPCPVLVFTSHQKGETHSLIATGSLYKVDPNRIIAKKIVLSGHPYKINKRSAVIRYMFFSREDILWFKPVELFTKYGRRGHIKEPLGTHGHMKCVLDGTLKAQDTICMNLYKRVFPKWSYESELQTPDIQQTFNDFVVMDT